MVLLRAFLCALGGGLLVKRLGGGSLVMSLGWTLSWEWRSSSLFQEQGDSGTEPEPGTGTVGTVKLIFPKPEAEPEAKPGGFQTWVFPTFSGKVQIVSQDPFGTVPRRCS